MAPVLRSLAAIVVILALITSPTWSALTVNMEQDASQLDDLWFSFKQTHNKVYANDDEDAYRRSVWLANVDRIRKHNIEADLGQFSFTLGVNEYSDLTFEEFKKSMLSNILPLNITATDDVPAVSDYKIDDVYLPATVDWRKQGIVTPVKNQGQCGSCWAFSTTGSLEGQNARKTGRLVSLSEQNLVDCSGSFGTKGCNGGWMVNAFQYIRANNGIDTAVSYPYEAKVGRCRYSPATVGSRCTGYVEVKGGEQALQQAVANIGPVSIAVDVGHPSFMQYKSGIYNEPRCNRARPNHAMLVVGYGTYNGVDYWLVKNSWGISWGMGGYIMMSRNKMDQCGIASYAVYPTV